MDKRIKNAVKYIDENLEMRIILKEITKISNLSYSRFAELFKKE